MENIGQMATAKNLWSRKADILIEVLPVNWNPSHSKHRNHSGKINGKACYLMNISFRTSLKIYPIFAAFKDVHEYCQSRYDFGSDPFPSSDWISQRATPRVNISCCPTHFTKHLQRLLKFDTKVLDEIAMYSVQISSVG